MTRTTMAPPAPRFMTRTGRHSFFRADAGVTLVTDRVDGGRVVSVIVRPALVVTANGRLVRRPALDLGEELRQVDPDGEGARASVAAAWRWTRDVLAAYEAALSGAPMAGAPLP